MGKAAIIIVPLVIVGAILFLVWGIAALAKWIDKPNKAPKEVRQKAALADEMYELIRDIMFPKSIDGDMSYLSEIHKAKAKTLAEKYGKVNS